MFTVSLLYLQNVCYYDSVYVLSFRSRINPDQDMSRRQSKRKEEARKKEKENEEAEMKK